MIIKITLVDGQVCQADPAHDYTIHRIVDPTTQNTGFGLYYSDDELPTFYYLLVDNFYQANITEPLFNKNGDAPFLPWMRMAIQRIEQVIEARDPATPYEKILADQNVKDRLGIAEI